MNEDSDLDFSEFIVSPSTGDLKVLAELVQRAEEIQSGLKKLDERYAHGASLLKELTDITIPQHCQDCGIKPGDAITFGGVKVEITDDVYCNIPAISSIEKERDDNRRAELIWRRETGLAFIEKEAPALIKRKYEIELDRDSAEQAELLEAKINELENPPEFTQGRNVHPSTLAKWVKEKKSAGYAFPEEIQKALGIYPKKIAKISK